MSICSPNAVAGPAIEAATTLAWTELAAIAGGEYYIEMVMLHRPRNALDEWVSAEGLVLGIAAERGKVRAAVVDGPRVDQDPGTAPGRLQPVLLDHLDEIMEDDLRCTEERRDVGDPRRNERHVIQHGVRGKVEDAAHHHHAVGRALRLSDIGPQTAAPVRRGDGVLVEPLVDDHHVDRLSSELGQGVGVHGLPGAGAVAEDRTVGRTWTPVVGGAAARVGADIEKGVRVHIEWRVPIGDHEVYELLRNVGAVEAVGDDQLVGRNVGRGSGADDRRLPVQRWRRYDPDFLQ